MKFSIEEIPTFCQLGTADIGKVNYCYSTFFFFDKLIFAVVLLGIFCDVSSLNSDMICDQSFSNESFQKQ